MPVNQTDFFGDDFFGGGGGGGGGGTPASRWIVVPVGLVTVSSTTFVPLGAYIVQARLIVATAYTAGTTISLGTATSAALFMATTENLPGLVETYYKWQLTSIGAAPAALKVTIAGAPAVGAATAVIEYTTPDV